MMEISTNTMNSQGLYGIQMFKIPDELKKVKKLHDFDSSFEKDQNTGIKVHNSSRADSHDELSEEELKKVEDLKKIDAEVKKHEQAHIAAAGNLRAGGPSYKYTIGPDGGRYATSGNVRIDTTEVPDDPEATIRKAEQIKRAALAPAEPSIQDQRVAAQAERMIAEARMELAKNKKENKEKFGEQALYSQDKLNSATSDTKINLFL